MIRSIYFNAAGKTAYNLSIPEMKKAVEDKDGLFWVSMEAPTEAEVLSILQDLFHFHPLTIEDTLSAGYQTPKVDDFESYIFVIVHAIRSNPNDLALETSEINLYIGDNYVVTLVQEEGLAPLNHIFRRLERDDRLLKNGSDFLAYGILDAIVDDYMPLIDQIDDELEMLEDSALEKPTPNLLQRLLDIKHALIYLRRIISPQREVMNRLSRDEYPMIDRQSKIYYRDVYDHLVRYQDLIESLRDIVGGAMDIYLNATSLRLNEVMKALTIVSTIFLPLSFVTGIYGMNFEYMPELRSPVAYPLIWGVFLLIVSSMLYLFKRRGWF